MIKKKKKTNYFLLAIILLLFSNLSYSYSSPIVPSNSNQKFFFYFIQAEQNKNQGNFESALAKYKNAEKFARIYSLKKEQLISSLNVALMLWNLGALPESLYQYNKALNLAVKLNFTKEINIIHNIKKIFIFYSKGKEFRKKNEYAKSIENFKKAISISSMIQSKEHKLKCLRQMSMTFFKNNDLEDFFSMNKSALNIASFLKHKKEQAKCLINIGIFYRKINKYSKAIYNYERALEIARHINEIELESACLNNIGIIYKELGNYNKSFEYIDKAYSIDEQLGDPINIAIDLINLGETLRIKGLASNNKKDLNSALLFFNKCLALIKDGSNKNIEVKVLNNIGTIESDLLNYSDALNKFQEAYDKSKEIHDIETMGMTLNNIGVIYYNLGRFKESSKYYDQAILLASRINGEHILWEAYLRKANSLNKQNKKLEAIESYKQSIEIIENIRSQITLEEFKASFIGTDKRIDAYHNLIDLYFKLDINKGIKKYEKDSFFYLEKAKARSFLDSLEEAKVDISKEIGLILQNKEKELSREISNIYTKVITSDLSDNNPNNLRDKLENLENQLEKLKRDIRTRNPAYANLKYPKIISLKEVQNQLLDNKSAFFEYMLGEKSCYVFVITKKNLKVFSAPSKNAIKSLVFNYLKCITDKNNNDFSIGYELYEKLVKPGLTKKMKKIIFIPDDILHYLPFETLICDKEKKQWLIEKYSISYSPSISALEEIINRRKIIHKKPSNTIIALGNPKIDTLNNNYLPNLNEFFSGGVSPFKELQYSALEIKKISSLFKANKEKILLGDACTEDNFKNQNLENYKIIHFATHSLIDDRKPERSTVVLSLDNDPKQDGFLQVREIYDLKLKSDLVTLSACQTGLGQLIKGEGIEGLKRAFFYAGSSAVLMSLWAINDQATYQLMERFYSYVRASNSLIEALRKTKLELIKSRSLSHPYFWASFIISGNADVKIFKPLNLEKWIAIILVFCFLLAGYIRIRSLS